jgi:hypothetical protein
MGSTNIHSSSELSAARELRAMMKEESCYAATMTMLARGRYRTEQWRTSPRYLHCVRRLWMCSRQCVSSVAKAYRSRCAAAGIIGRDSQAGGYTS